MNTAIYLRISEDRDATERGIARQEEDCRGLVQELDWRVTDVFIDNDVSAFNVRSPRLGYEAMLRAIRARRVDCVVAWHIDRLHRSPRELERYLDLCTEFGVATHTVRSGALDLATASGRMVARMLVAAALQEVELKGERTKRAQRQAAEGGRWLGGARPFGWTMTPVRLHPVEAPLVAEASARVIAGGSLNSIVREWNASGVTTSYGNSWTVTQLRQVLLRARNAGLATWKGQVVGDSVFPPILDEDTFREVSRVLRDPSRRRSSSNATRWLLAGIALCECGAPVRSASASARDGSTRAIYRCRSRGAAGHVSKNAPPCDAVVEQTVRKCLLLAGGAAPSSRDTLGMIDESARLREVLSDVADSYCDGVVDLRQFERVSERAQSRLDEIGQTLAIASQDVDGRAPFGWTGVARWDAADLTARRDVLRDSFRVDFKRSPVSGARAFDPSLVRIVPVGALADALLEA